MNIGLFLATIGKIPVKKYPKYLKTRWNSYRHGYPHTIMIEPTNACNLSCPLCPSSPNVFRKGGKGMMKLDHFKTVIDRIKDYTFFVPLWFRGEPMMNPHFLEMVKYADAAGLFVSTSTNGTYIKESNIDKILHSGLGELILSFDGLTKKSYEAYRVGSSFEEVKKNLILLNKRKKELGLRYPLITMQFIVMKTNEKEVTLLPEIKNEWGFDRVYIKSAGLPTWFLTDERTKELFKEWMPENTMKRYNDKDATVKSRLGECEFTKKSTIGWDGNVTTCCYDIDGKHISGNLLEQDFPSIWNGEKYTKKRKFGVAKYKLDICKTCSIGKNLTKEI